jgi:hypothetical protein
MSKRTNGNTIKGSTIKGSTIRGSTIKGSTTTKGKHMDMRQTQHHGVLGEDPFGVARVAREAERRARTKDEPSEFEELWRVMEQCFDENPDADSESVLHRARLRLSAERWGASGHPADFVDLLRAVIGHSRWAFGEAPWELKAELEVPWDNIEHFVWITLPGLLGIGVTEMLERRQ